MVSNGVKSSSQKAESEVQKGHVVNKQLTLIRNEMVDLVKDSEVLLKAADEMSSAAVIALKGSNLSHKPLKNSRPPVKRA